MFYLQTLGEYVGRICSDADCQIDTRSLGGLKAVWGLWAR
uniref:Uncharacterized protein n=1 Tax=Aegilops tauschii subsp. strangulata TaxID=200361 RepID=A0A452YEX5_AEGTS